MLKSSSEERIEMRVCETRRSASYRLDTAVSAALGSVPRITVQWKPWGAQKQRSSEFRESYQEYTPGLAPTVTQEPKAILRPSIAAKDLWHARQISVSRSCASRFSAR